MSVVPDKLSRARAQLLIAIQALQEAVALLDEYNEQLRRRKQEGTGE